MVIRDWDLQWKDVDFHMIDLQQKTEERNRNHKADKSRKLYAILGININEFINISQVKFLDFRNFDYVLCLLSYKYIYVRKYYFISCKWQLLLHKKPWEKYEFEIKVKWFPPNWIANSLWSFERFDIW